VLLSDFHCKENDKRFGIRVVPVDPGLVISDYGVHEVGITVCAVQHILGIWLYFRNQIVLSFSSQGKSDESTKHYLRQMLLAINWRY
jgi:hypothetical protein